MNGGFVEPTVRAEGKGTKAIFSLLDVYALALFRHLVEELHFNREEASKFSNAWRKYVSSYKDKIKVKNDIPERALSKLLSNELVFLFAKENEEKKLLYRPFSFHGKKEKVFRSVIEDVEKTIKGREWDVIFVINFKKIMSQVDDSINAAL
jgi:hypothetical protein